VSYCLNCCFVQSVVAVAVLKMFWVIETEKDFLAAGFVALYLMMKFAAGLEIEAVSAKKLTDICYKPLDIHSKLHNYLRKEMMAEQIDVAVVEAVPAIGIDVIVVVAVFVVEVVVVAVKLNLMEIFAVDFVDLLRIPFVLKPNHYHL